MEEKIRQWTKLSSRIRRKLFPRKIDNYGLYLTSLGGKNGLEIGGPTKNFKKRGLVPVYGIIRSLDGCNFANETVWEGRIEEGANSYFYSRFKPRGYQYIGDATNLQKIEEEKYDFVLSSHCIEHIANPLKALSEWVRVLKKGGFLLMIAPHKDRTSDHKRPVTRLEHLIDDFQKSTTEDDLSHLAEILKLQDFVFELAKMDLESFRLRAMKNYENRCLHHHIFDTRLVLQVVDYFKLQILDVQPVLPIHIVVFAKKISDGDVDNSVFLSNAAGYRFISPFPSDFAR